MSSSFREYLRAGFVVLWRASDLFFADESAPQFSFMVDTGERKTSANEGPLYADSMKISAGEFSCYLSTTEPRTSTYGERIGRRAGRTVAQLADELAEAREQQAASSAIMWAISASPGDPQPALGAIAQSAARLCKATHSFVGRFDGELLQFVAGFGLPSAAVDTIAQSNRGVRTARGGTWQVSYVRNLMRRTGMGVIL